MESIEHLLSADLARLLSLLTMPALLHTDGEGRRRQTLLAMMEVLDAQAGHWAWGRGNPATGNIVPVASMQVGMTDPQRHEIYSHALQPESVRTFQGRLMPRVLEKRALGVTRRDVLPDDEWAASTHWQEHVGRLGFDSWTHGIYYRTADTWCCVHFHREPGREEFGPRQACLVEQAIQAIDWLFPPVSESIPPSRFEELSPRRAEVMACVLDGMSRKDIARVLAISEETVGDHLTAVYEHFGVRTSGELAAKFLRSV